MKCLFATLLLLNALAATAQTKKYAVTNGLSATINHMAGSRTVQVLMPGVEAIELDLSQPPANAFSIKTADYNFDGYRDFAFTSKDAAPGAATIYDIFLYHPAEKTFEALEVPGGACEVLGNVRVNASDKTLRSSCRSGAKSSLDIYTWSDPFTLALSGSTDNSTDAQADRAEEKADAKADKAEQRAEKREKLREAREDKEEED